MKRRKVATSGTGSRWIEQTRELKLAPVTGDPWERIEAQAKADMLHKGRLFWAVESMIREQSAPLPQGGREAEKGEQTCDHCGRLATMTWERSAAYMAKHRGRKVKGSFMPMAPVSWRCSLHVPYFAPELAEQYRDARVARVSETAVA